MGGPIIVFAREFSLPGAITFWNLRATSLPESWPTETRLIWLPPPALEDARIWDRLRDACTHSFTDPDLVLVGDDRDWLRMVASNAGFVESTGTKSSTSLGLPTKPRDFVERPLRFRLNAHPAAWLWGERLYGKRVQVPVTVTRPATTVHFNSPVQFSPKLFGYLRVEIDGIEALRWPKRDEVARLIEPNASYRPEGLSLLAHPQPRYTFTLRVPSATEVVSAVLTARGWSWQRSDKGRYAQSLIDAVGNRLPVLASPAALAVCRALATLSRVKAEQLLESTVARGTPADEVIRRVAEALVARTARWRPIQEIAGELHQRTRELLPTLNQLIEARLVSRGFAFTCPSCGLGSAVPFDRAADEVRCEGCRVTATLIGPPSQEPVILYAMNSLLDRALDQDCVSHVLTLRWVVERRAAVWAVPGAEVRASGNGLSREVDLLALSRDALLVGEMKESSLAFDGRTLRRTADLARALGANILILSSMDDWPHDRRAEAVAIAAKNNLEVIALEGRDLFSLTDGVQRASAALETAAYT
jgi:ribosomal protein S27E